ncbi:MAG: glutamate racemase [Nitrospinae bacterium]|nr:glutamate racemase [Nitrospinota bacterium]
MDRRPIGIFDSGIGGLTVLHEVGQLLPNERLVYLGDTARVPYGTKSPETVTRYSIENTRFLMSKDVKAVVVACNTASAASVDALRAEFDVPVLGVIEAGVEEALSRSVEWRIGVIGTQATVLSGKYESLLRAKGAAEVVSAACPLFVPLAEEGWTDNKVAEEVARIYLQPFLGGAVDTLILGCTHYPLLQGVIGKVCGPEVRLVNSAHAIAVKLRDQLQSGRIENNTGPGDREYFFTDSAERAGAVGSRFLGENLDNRIQLVDLTPFESGKP